MRVPSPQEYAHGNWSRAENDEILNQLSYRSLGAQEAYGTAYLYERMRMSSEQLESATIG